MRKIYFIYTIFLIAFCILAVSANEKYSFDQWSTDNGLPHNSVRRIVQTPDGYLWVTTFDGLARFDGVRFTVFNSINTKEITDNRFFDAFVEDDGTLWASMLNGSVVRYKDGKFKSFDIRKLGDKASNTIFKKDKKGNLLFISGTAADNQTYYLKNNELVLAPKEYQNKKYNWLFVNEKTFWEFKTNEVTEHIDGKITKYPHSHIETFNIRNRNNYFVDKKGFLWLGDRSNLYKFSQGKIENYPLPSKLTEKITEKDFVRISPNLEDKKGNIWVELKINRNSSIYRFKNGEVDFSDENLVFGAEDNASFFAFEDKEGFIWLGSVQGIFRLRKNLIQTLSAEQGLVDRQIYPIFERKNGEILLGSFRNLDIYKDGKFTQESKKQDYKSFAEDKKGRLWLGSSGITIKKGVRTKQLVVYENGIEKDLSHLVDKNLYNVWAIKSDKEDNIWLGTNVGIHKVREDKIVRRYTKKDGLLSDDISFIHESRNGVFWFGTAQGIAKLENDEITTYTTEDGLAGNRIRTIYEDSDGTIWIGTYGNGLSRFKDGQFFNYSTKDGLYHNGVFQIFEDDNKNFWIGGNQGIYRVARKELNLYAEGKIARVNSFGYGKEDGMKHAEVNGGKQPAGIKASDGRLWFPTMDGVAIIDPNNIEYNENVPTALIEDVTIEREKAEMQDGVTVGVGKDDVEIHYTAPSFIKPKQIRFKYKLEGFNEDWIEAGTRRTAYYSYLPPGDYTFCLLVANSDGIWNEQETTLNIKVLAPFYRTNWFFASMILAILATAFLLYRYRVNLLKKRNAEQMAFSQQLISLQEDERKRIAAGLHDSLGQHLIIIKNWATLALGIMDKKSPAREQVSEISDTSLQALEEVREIINDLRPHQIETVGLTDTIKTMIEQVESASGINFDLEYDKIDHLFNKEDEVTFYRIIQEYVNNIVKHSEAENAFVSIRNGSNTIKVKISDDGKGFNLEDSKLKKNGFGLTGIEERLKMLGGEQTIKSELGKGTEIDIFIELK